MFRLRKAVENHEDYKLTVIYGIKLDWGKYTKVIREYNNGVRVVTVYKKEDL